VLVVGSMISLGYYLRVVATMWMGAGASATGRTGPSRRSGVVLSPVAGGSPESEVTAPDGGAGAEGGAVAGGGAAAGLPGSGRAGESPQAALVAVLFAAACVFFGIFPSPLFHLAAHAGHALDGLF
jgi:NADH-quinone oxidoreductase subunit N